jgi:hypothetical protein
MDQQTIRRAQVARRDPRKQTPEMMARRPLEIVVYSKHCQIGVTHDRHAGAFDLIEQGRRVAGFSYLAN